MDADGTPPLPVVALADVVRLRTPYEPVRGHDRQRGPFGFGVVAELLTVLADGRVRSASLYLYDPARRELFLGPNGIPEFVDCHGSEFELYKRADDAGYTPLVPPPYFGSSDTSERQVIDGA